MTRILYRQHQKHGQKQGSITMRKMSFAALSAASLLLAGCGGASDTAKESGSSETASTDGASGPPAGWNAADACAVVDKAKMAAIVGKPVSEASLGLVHVSSGADATTSECSYIMEDGDRASVMLRWSPIADNSEGAINLARNGAKQTIEAFGGTIENVDGLGKSAFWIGKTDTMNVFIGEDKFVIITLPGGSASKEQATTLARQLGA